MTESLFNFAVCHPLTLHHGCDWLSGVRERERAKEKESSGKWHYLWEKNRLFVFPAGFVDCVISEVCFRGERTTGWIGHSFNSTSLRNTELLSRTFNSSRDLMFYVCTVIFSDNWICLYLLFKCDMLIMSGRINVCVWLCFPFSFTCPRFTLAVLCPFVKLGGKGSLFVLDSVMSLCDPSYWHFGHMTGSSEVLLPQDALLRHAHHPWPSRVNVQ